MGMPDDGGRGRPVRSSRHDGDGRHGGDGHGRSVTGAAGRTAAATCSGRPKSSSRSGRARAGSPAARRCPAMAHDDGESRRRSGRQGARRQEVRGRFRLLGADASSSPTWRWTAWAGAPLAPLRPTARHPAHRLRPRSGRCARSASPWTATWSATSGFSTTRRSRRATLSSSAQGEVVRFIMINRTMMHHPMHLHGHFFRVVNGQGDCSPLKHTVDVAPMSTTVIEFDADERGDWFFHCHLLYHMMNGMARVVHYEDFALTPELAAIRPGLYHDEWHAMGQVDLLSNMAEGSVMLSGTRTTLTADGEIGWQGVSERVGGPCHGKLLHQRILVRLRRRRPRRRRRRHRSDPRRHRRSHPAAAQSGPARLGRLGWRCPSRPREAPAAHAAAGSHRRRPLRHARPLGRTGRLCLHALEGRLPPCPLALHLRLRRRSGNQVLVSHLFRQVVSPCHDRPRRLP